MDAIVTAGGIPRPDDPLYPYSNGDSKALIEIAGKPMIQWVLDALSETETVDNVIIIGLTAKSDLTCKKPLHYVSNQGRMLANIVAGVNKSLELNKKNEYVVLVSSDIPAITSDMIDWMVNTSTQTHDDLYYGVCPRETMEARYPTSNRTYTKIKDMEICGADISVIHVSMATEHLDMWETLIGNRKSPLRQAAVLGWDTLFGLLFRKFNLQELAERVSERIGIKGRVIICEHAEAGMDIDKPHQLELVRADLENQVALAAVAKKKAEAKAKRAATPKEKVVVAKPKAKAKPK